MDIEVLLGLLAIGLVIGVPTVAFVALARTGQLSRDILALRATVGQMRGELAELRRQEPAAGETREAKPAVVAATEAVPPIEEPALQAVVAEDLAPAQEPPIVSPPPSQNAADETAQPPPAIAPVRVANLVLEERIGARIFVWVDGVALALAGAFLVKYSIDA